MVGVDAVGVGKSSPMDSSRLFVFMCFGGGGGGGPSNSEDSIDGDNRISGVFGGLRADNGCPSLAPLLVRPWREEPRTSSSRSNNAAADSILSGMVDPSSSVGLSTKPCGRGDSGEKGDGSMGEWKNGTRGCVRSTSFAMVSRSLSLGPKGTVGLREVSRESIEVYTR